MRRGRPRTDFVVNNHKLCTKCHQNRSVRRFYKHSNRRSGYHSWCKDCESTYNRDYARTPQYKKVRRAWREKNPTRVRGYQDKANARLKKQRQADPDRFRNYDLKKIGITLQEKKRASKNKEKDVRFVKRRPPTLRKRGLQTTITKRGSFAAFYVENATPCSAMPTITQKF
jgi:hypothetical protein